MHRNEFLLDKVVEITASKMSNTTMPPSKDGGIKVAEFMQEIYNKLVELNGTDED